jgi:hypothetical protein
MGWTYTERDKGTPELEWWRREFDHAGGRVLDCASRLGEAYIAFELRDKETGEPRAVIGIALLTNWRRADRFNFGWKDMSEDMGPGISRCPERILRQLTPIRDLMRGGTFSPQGALWAWHWRRRCLANLTERADLAGRVRALRPGDVLTWSAPISTNLGPVSTLRVLETGRRLVLTDGCYRYRFTRATVAQATISRPEPAAA